MTPEGRQVLLLTTLEGFPPREAAMITGHSEAEIGALVREAVAEIDRQTATTVLIIEDEPLISLDLSEIVESLGHRVTTVARTADQAVEAARAAPPGLVLADIQLADGSSGLDAVRDILGHFEVPVIFVTSFPERLLTGQRPEPTFLITKPYDPNAVKAAISQALFFRTAPRSPPERRRSPALGRAPLSASVPREPVVDFALGFVLGLAVALLDAPGQLLLPALDLVEVVVGQGAPLLLYLALELLPVPFDAIPVHLRSSRCMIRTRHNATSRSTVPRAAPRGPEPAFRASRSALDRIRRTLP